jgi:uncharacterized integral membrane protein
VIVLIALVIFLLSNREPTIIGFWPFGTLGSAALGAVVLIAFALGMLIGMVLLIPHRMRAHRRARRAEKQVAAMQASQPVPPAIVTPSVAPADPLLTTPSQTLLPPR